MDRGEWGGYDAHASNLLRWQRFHAAQSPQMVQAPSYVLPSPRSQGNNYLHWAFKRINRGPVVTFLNLGGLRIRRV